jgi:hypothetical protein
MSTDAKVEANGFHAGPLCLFFSLRMKVVHAHVGPFFLFVFLKHVANLLLSYGQVFRVESLFKKLFDSRF